MRYLQLAIGLLIIVTGALGVANHKSYVRRIESYKANIDSVADQYLRVGEKADSLAFLHHVQIEALKVQRQADREYYTKYTMKLENQLRDIKQQNAEFRARLDSIGYLPEF